MNANKDHFHTVVGERIKATREAAGLSIARLAKDADTTPSAIDKAELGVTCSLYMLARIADALDCTLDDLVPLDALDEPADEAAE